MPAHPAPLGGPALHDSCFLKRIRATFLLLLLVLLQSPCGWASVQQEVQITGHVQPFGGYVFTESVTFKITKPGKQEIGVIVVDGLYNGEYPWIMRAYTENLHVSGIGGSLHVPPPAGLVSEDGQFVVPLFISSPSFGAEGGRRIPDLSEPEYMPYAPDPDPGHASYTDCILLGIDPRNGAWVAGPDGLLHTADDNFIGDNTVATPFEMVLQADVPPSAVRGKYTATLYIEIVSAP